MSILGQLRRREEGQSGTERQIEKANLFSQEKLDRLNLWRVLEGHQGCVNCLQWNRKGDLLASGSDDLKVILWSPFKSGTQQKNAIIPTKHTGNIFSVKFLPHSDDRLIVTSAGDAQVHLYDVNSMKKSDEESPLRIYSNHHSCRVKRLEVCHEEPHMVWSAGEDGIVSQIDTRELSSSSNSSSVLVNLNSAVSGSGAEAKCLSVNPAKSHMMAVGANDPFVRLYDRRMIRSQALPDSSIGLERRREFTLRPHIVKKDTDYVPNYLVPGHLPYNDSAKRRIMRMHASTYVSFSPDGKELLANIGGEQIYLFGLDQGRDSVLNEGILLPENGTRFAGVASEDENSPSDNNSSQHKLSPEAARLKELGNRKFEAHKYIDAIAIYNEAIAKHSNSQLYANRAAALMKRKWTGDIYQALRDCLKAVELNPGYVKAHLRIARCLLELDKAEESKKYLDAFAEHFPTHLNSNSYEQLNSDIESKLDAISCMKSDDERAKRRRKSGDNDQSEIEDSDEEEVPELIDDLRGFLGRADDLDEDEEEESNQAQESNSDDRPHQPPPLPSSSGGGAPRSNNSSSNPLHLTQQKDLLSEETRSRKAAWDYKRRFVGHCNTTTDIKEAVFIGGSGEFVMAGSDDGNIFFWNKSNATLQRVVSGDESIVNCLQPHPTGCVIASSGIDPVVRLWTPMPYDDEGEPLDSENDRVMKDSWWNDLEKKNQTRMTADPFESLFFNVSNFGRMAGAGGGEGSGRERGGFGPGDVQCRPS